MIRARAEPFVATALLAVDGDGNQIVSVHCKRTYAFDGRGRCRLSDYQAPFFEPVTPPEGPWHSELDVWPSKRGTDLIVHARAYGGGSGRASASICVTDRTLTYAVSGDRKVLYRGQGAVAFSEPQPFDAMAITYENAYGGSDRLVPIAAREMLRDVFGCDATCYPRNTVGKGYVVVESRDAIDGLPLPNIEHPQQLLTPERLIIRDPLLWWRQPLAWSCDWFDRSWYPRCSFFGTLPQGMPDDDRTLSEVELGWVEAGQRARIEGQAVDDLLDNRYFSAASPGLVLPFMRGDESIAFGGMTPDGDFVLTLPGVRPKMKVRFDGRTHDVDPVPNRILIDVDQRHLSIVWHGAWRTPRLLPERFPTLGDTVAMELEDVDAWVDGVPIPKDGAE